jgi:hypothetical protein
MKLSGIVCVLSLFCLGILMPSYAGTVNGCGTSTLSDTPATTASCGGLNLVFNSSNPNAGVTGGTDLVPDLQLLNFGYQQVPPDAYYYPDFQIKPGTVSLAAGLYYVEFQFIDVKSGPLNGLGFLAFNGLTDNNTLASQHFGFDPHGDPNGAQFDPSPGSPRVEFAEIACTGLSGKVTLTTTGLSCNSNNALSDPLESSFANSGITDATPAYAVGNNQRFPSQENAYVVIGLQVLPGKTLNALDDFQPILVSPEPATSVLFFLGAGLLFMGRRYVANLSAGFRR